MWKALCALRDVLMVSAKLGSRYLSLTGCRDGPWLRWQRVGPRWFVDLSNFVTVSVVSLCSLTLVDHPLPTVCVPWVCCSAHVHAVWWGKWVGTVWGGWPQLQVGYGMLLKALLFGNYMLVLWEQSYTRTSLAAERPYLFLDCFFSPRDTLKVKAANLFLAPWSALSERWWRHICWKGCTGCKHSVLPGPSLLHPRGQVFARGCWGLERPLYAKYTSSFSLGMLFNWPDPCFSHSGNASKRLTGAKAVHGFVSSWEQ